MSITRALIDLDRLVGNAGVFREAAPDGMDIMAVVKGDAYGHGAVACSRALVDAGIRWLAVATLEEAATLRENGIDEHILVFAPPLADRLPAYAALNVDITAVSIEVLEAIVAYRPELVERLHVKVDTGMSRLGIQPPDIGRAAAILHSTGYRPRAIWTHLAHSASRPDPRSVDQDRILRTVAADHGLADVPRHILNTGGFVHHKELRRAEDPLARIGIGLYGIALTSAPPADRLQPVMRVLSRVLQVKHVEAGTGVSYDHTWRAPEATRIATIGAGYADGVPRLLSNRGAVGFPGPGTSHPIVGRVCMDMMMVDIGPAPEAATSDIATGDEVVLLGTGGPTAAQVAHWADTISYEICTGLGARVPREYADRAGQ